MHAPAAPAMSFVRTSASADDDPLVLPDAWTPPARPGVPMAAAIVPVVGAVAIWLVTGSPLSLWLAALGPLLAIASAVDSRRTARRDRRQAEVEAAHAREAVGEEIARRHGEERALRWAHRPDALGMLLSDADIWRADSGRGDVLVIGAGEETSRLRVIGGKGDAEARELRDRAARLLDAPVAVPLGAGVAVVGDGFAVAAAVRALVLQACLMSAPGQLRVVGACAGHEWALALPHRRATRGRTLALVGPNAPIPDEADIVIAAVAPGDPPPPRCGALLQLHGLTQGTLDYGGCVQRVRVEAVGARQAAAIAAGLAARAGAAFPGAVAAEPVALHALPVPAGSGGLAAAVGVGDGGPVVLDLVADGPHAVVAGVTGAGKSELLITWILAMSAAHSTGEVSFLLADFKGGTAFDPLRVLPHVTGVITDLDGAGARRAIESLRAEVRWRESALAAAGARDIDDARVTVPRLVIVVDEFAALLQAQPELHAVFADVAARGRALGMHLILGTQRASGVIRDSLMANCPLRLSLRVTDRADSRAVLGTDGAAEIPGGADGRGVALVRRAADATPARVRIALSAPDDITAVAARERGAATRRPWLPALPDMVRLDDLVVEAHSEDLVLGLADEPEHQRQQAVGIGVRDRGLLVIGGPGSGRSCALEVLAAQAGDVVRVGPSPEQAWDALDRLDEGPVAPGTLVVADDLDALVGLFPPEYAQEVVERIERVARAAGQRGLIVAASAQRLSGAVARIADLFPRRLLLRTASRADHFAAGGDPASFEAHRTAGRGHLDGVSVQVAWTEPAADSAPAAETAWFPRASLTGFVSRRSPGSRAALEQWQRAGHRVMRLDAFAADGHPGEPVVVAGDPEEWQRHWRVLGEVRADHDLVVDAACAGDLRALTAARALAPYAEPGRGRAWLMSAGGPPARVVLPGGGSEDPLVKQT